MMGIGWMMRQRVRLAAKNLQLARILIEGALEICEAVGAQSQFAEGPVRRAKAHILTSRRQIEELPFLSLNGQSRFFRLFECIEEYLDYAGESIVYEECSAATTDLHRSLRTIENAELLLFSQTGVRSHKLPFTKLARRVVIRTAQSKRLQPRFRPEVIELQALGETQEDSESRPSAMLL
jgi:hypothetical protein